MLMILSCYLRSYFVNQKRDINIVSSGKCYKKLRRIAKSLSVLIVIHINLFILENVLSLFVNFRTDWTNLRTESLMLHSKQAILPRLLYLVPESIFLQSKHQKIIQGQKTIDYKIEAVKVTIRR